MEDSTQRFSSRVENYVKYRPGYPAAIIGLLAERCGLTSSSVVTDVGSGTGILAELFLKNGNPVFGVEPNAEMRAAGERLLASYPAFHSIDGTAEATTLPDASADIAVAGQAFHWFDRDGARREFARILRPAGWVALIWNDRRADSTPFHRTYEDLLRTYGTDYEQVHHGLIDDATIAAFFAPSGFDKHQFPNHQVFDYAGLEGRLLSSSYTPEPGHPNHTPMLGELRRIFEEHQRDGTITFEYDTTVFLGRLV